MSTDASTLERALRPLEEDLLTFLDNMIDVMAGLNRGRNPGWAYSSTYAYVRDRGQFHDPAPLPRGVRRRPVGQCFLNAYRLARASLRSALRTGRPSTEALTYVEGYAIPVHNGQPLIPMAHAWTTTPSGVVVDPTWDTPEACAYYGVSLPLETVTQFKSAARPELAVIENNYRLGWSILRTGDPVPGGASAAGDPKE